MIASESNLLQSRKQPLVIRHIIDYKQRIIAQDLMSFEIRYELSKQNQHTGIQEIIIIWRRLSTNTSRRHINQIERLRTKLSSLSAVVDWKTVDYNVARHSKDEKGAWHIRQIDGREYFQLDVIYIVVCRR